MATRKTSSTPRKITKTTRKKGKDHVLKGLPVLWAHRLDTQAIGFHIDHNEVWGGAASPAPG